MFKQLKTGLILLISLSILTGIIYPLAITAIAQLMFPWQAKGSLIKLQEKTVGSALLGQNFTATKYFWGRPSATSPYPYYTANSGSSNMGPNNPDFLKTVQQRVIALQQANPQAPQSIPVDLITASGSGLDPDISTLSALYQVPRIATARGISEAAVEQLIHQYTQYSTLGVLGEARVNVLTLNLALDKL